MKVLLALNHAPDYRETFLQEVGKSIELTVVAQPCERDSLIPPQKRERYNYIELPTRRLLGLNWQPGLKHIVREENWDIVCISFNPRQFSWLYLFYTNPTLWKKWIWWGSIFGKNDSKILSTIRKYVFSRSAGCLVYSDPIAQRIKDEYLVDALSFNNTEIEESDFHNGLFDDHSEVRLLFVGRFQPRKKLERLVELVKRRKDVHVRFVGPGMEQLYVPDELIESGRVKVFGRTIGQELIPHFNWADLVANPGAAGLLVMNSARYGKGIVIDDHSNHGPEYWMAMEAEQPFISFKDSEIVDKFIDDIKQDRSILRSWGTKLQRIAMDKYTIEAMAEVHLRAFKAVLKGEKVVNGTK